MEMKKDESGGCVERQNKSRREKVKLAGVVMKPRGSGAELAADVERETCSGGDARNSEQHGKRRGIG